jgi:RNA polymerase sigma-70 factor (ECF subfamily)
MTSGQSIPATTDVAPSQPLRRLEELFPAIAAGDGAARDEVVGIVVERMRRIAHRMLRSFRHVRRWDDTDDILQNAAIRFLRALDDTTPADPRHLVNIATLQIRRELVDLARKHRGPESYAMNHQSNSVVMQGEVVMHVDVAADPHATGGESERWSAFHAAAAALPAEERQVFDLAWFLGADQTEVARHLGCSVRTVKRRWEIVKRHLRAACGDELPPRE